MDGPFWLKLSCHQHHVAFLSTPIPPKVVRWKGQTNGEVCPFQLGQAWMNACAAQTFGPNIPTTSKSELQGGTVGLLCHVALAIVQLFHDYMEYIIRCSSAEGRKLTSAEVTSISWTDTFDELMLCCQKTWKTWCGP